MENSPLLYELGAMVALLALNAFFVSVEFAYITVPRPRIDQLVHRGDKRALRVQRLLSDTDRVLAASQLGITAASLGLGWFGENATQEILRLVSVALPPGWNTAIALTIGALISFGAITAFHIVLGEQAPKIIAISEADRFALYSARVVALFDIVMRPFIWFLDMATTATVRLFGMKPVGAHQTIYTAEELKQLVSETHASGEISHDEKEMIHNVFEFGDLRVREVMTPRPEMITLDENVTAAEFLQTFSESIRSRYPVYSGNVDNITGYLGIKDVLLAFASKGAEAFNESIRASVRTATFVPETNRVGRLFTEMQAQRTQVAIVIDEFGGTAGMVTLDHLTEQIVGRIRDELAQEAPLVETIDEKTAQIDAQIRVEQANEELGLALATSDEYETISGFILHALRRIPKEGDQFRTGDLRITITRMDGPKIEKVLVTRL